MIIKKSQSKGFTLLNNSASGRIPAKRDLTGFTLVEILLVIFLILFFTGLTLANYKSGGKTLALNRSANQLAQDIRRAEQKAMSTAVCEECGGIIPIGGYGIYLEEETGIGNGKKYLLFADESGSGLYNWPDKQIGDDILLEKGVYIDNIEVIENSVHCFLPNVSVNFQQPEPLIRITEGGFYADKVIITLALESDPSKTAIVEVNVAGLIEIK